MAYILEQSVIREEERLFGKGETQYVLTKLKNSELPMERSAPPPRVHIAVLWLSDGDIELFDREMGRALSDWRDSLVSAGLGDENWREVLNEKDVDCSGW